MIALEFSGWFQCRLATDPDPFDEPRGVSGYVRAYADEPDLDRVIRFQDPPFSRVHTPEVGVTVRKVFVNRAEAPDHPLVGASVDLLGSPMFEGRNGAIADDGREPIWPFHIEIRSGAFRIARSTVPSKPDFPYDEFRTTEFAMRPEWIERVCGLTELAPIWERRRELLSAHHASSDEPHRTAIRERLSFLDEYRTNAKVLGFLYAVMSYEYRVRSAPFEIHDPDALLSQHMPELDWHADFTMGGWDSDALCGFVHGTLTIGDPTHPGSTFKDNSAQRPSRRP